ncbi:hypothetical protein H4R27_006297, partial [Coemansia aciculifera]
TTHRRVTLQRPAPSPPLYNPVPRTWIPFSALSMAATLRQTRMISIPTTTLI